jgi:hypothetical protein
MAKRIVTKHIQGRRDVKAIVSAFCVKVLPILRFQAARAKLGITPLIVLPVHQKLEQEQLIRNVLLPLSFAANCSQDESADVSSRGQDPRIGTRLSAALGVLEGRTI